eukprot:5585320-Prymnesium_polylepis.2
MLAGSAAPAGTPPEVVILTTIRARAQLFGQRSTAFIETWTLERVSGPAPRSLWMEPDPGGRTALVRRPETRPSADLTTFATKGQICT